MTGVNEQKKRGCRTPMMGLLGLAFLLVGGYFWFNASLGRLFQSIAGGSSIGLSESMEPFELKFRTSAKDVSPLEAKSLPRKEWILAVPRAFVVDMVGINGAHGPDEAFYASLEFIQEPSSNKLIPLAQANFKPIIDHAIFVRLENSGGYPQVALVDHCVRYDDFSSFLSEYNIKERDGKCGDNFPRCVVYTHLEGWHVMMQVPRSIYFNDIQPICLLVKKTLNQYTIRRDKLR